MLALLATLTAFLLARVSWQAHASSTEDINHRPPQPQENSCGEIIRNNTYENDIFFYAHDVIECLTSVPFNSAVGLRLLDYLNATFQFHATTAYQKDPPEEYQQPPLDLFKELEQVREHVTNGAYHNQYAFETAVQRVIQRSHDQHLSVYGGIFSLFDFMNSINLVSVSKDGKEAPEIYIYEDLVRSVSASGSPASPISEINGEPAVSFLTDFAIDQSLGMVEPHADWNSLMYSPAQQLFGLSSFSDSVPFYPGDLLKLTLRNETDPIEREWIALYNSAGFTGPLETGGDFYNFFVLGMLPANFDDQYAIYLQDQSDSGSSDDQGYTLVGDDEVAARQSSWHNDNPAYPAGTISHQADLGVYNTGSVTGYHFAEISTSVLSIPSFAMYGDSLETFEHAITDFIKNTTAANRRTDKMIIDLQQNQGGVLGLAYYVFDQFFPNARPFSGSRRRAHPPADALGNATTTKFDSLPTNFSDIDWFRYMASEWTVTNRINAATGRNFTSWDEFYGPTPLHADEYSLIEQVDLSNQIFVRGVLGADMKACYYTRSCDSTAPWKPEDIVIMTDGICGSTCSLFVEMMHEAGVRTVVVGGRPEEGPMQAASGSRGAVEYSGDELSDDYSLLTEYESDSPSPLLNAFPSDTGMYITYTGFTLRDQVRKGQKTPNQVAYIPANCRLYWTLSNFYNYTRLWSDVHEAAFVDPSMCVPGSTNVTQAPSRQLVPRSEQRSPEDPDHEHFSDAEYFATADLPELPWDGPPEEKPTTCNSDRDCYGYKCLKFDFGCVGCDGTVCEKKKLGVCSRACPNGDDNQCTGTWTCQEQARVASKTNSEPFHGLRASRGRCIPPWPPRNRALSCSAITKDTLPKWLSAIRSLLIG